MSTDSDTQTPVEAGVAHPTWKSERPTFTVTLPSGWARSALAGIEAALLGWLIPTLAVAVGFLADSSNAWLRDTSIGEAGRSGTEFWAMTLGSPAVFYGVTVSIIPLLWTLIQVVVFRALLLSGRNFGSAALWTSIPFYLLTVLIVLTASGAQVILWRALGGAGLISLIAVGWAVARQTETFPRWAARLRWVWSGTLIGLSWLAAVAAVGLTVFVTALAVSWQEVTAATELFGFSSAGNFGLGAMQAMYLPMFMACAIAWVSGAGFSVVGGLVSSAHVVAPNETIFLPIVATIPTTAPGAWVPALLAFGGVGLGVVFSVVTSRLSLVDASRRGAVALASFAAVIYVWMSASRGSLGENLLATLGPTPGAWLVTTGLVGCVALVVGVALHPETRRRAKEGFGSFREADSADEGEGVDSTGGDAIQASVDDTDVSDNEADVDEVGKGSNGRF